MRTPLAAERRPMVKLATGAISLPCRAMRRDGTPNAKPAEVRGCSCRAQAVGMIPECLYQRFLLWLVTPYRRHIVVASASAPWLSCSICGKPGSAFRRSHCLRSFVLSCGWPRRSALLLPMRSRFGFGDCRPIRRPTMWLSSNRAPPMRAGALGAFCPVLRSDVALSAEGGWRCRHACWRAEGAADNIRCEGHCHRRVVRS